MFWDLEVADDDSLAIQWHDYVNIITLSSWVKGSLDLAI